MKNKLINLGLVCWHFLTDVPGWPDAPKWMRWRRALPILIPCSAILVLVFWSVAVRDPQIRAARAAHQPLFALEEEIAALRLKCSEQQATELATKSAAVADLLLREPAELGPWLHTLKQEAVNRKWEANFQAGDASAETPDAADQVIFLPVRGRLASTADNPASFSALLALLDRYSSTGKRIDLTRLAIRADEQGRYAVELNLRLACRRPHEKTAQ